MIRCRVDVSGIIKLNKLIFDSRGLKPQWYDRRERYGIARKQACPPLGKENDRHRSYAPRSVVKAFSEYSEKAFISYGANTF